MNGSADHKIAVFTEALRLPEHERAAYLERACGGDVESHRAVEALLQEHSQVGDFLETSPNASLIKTQAESVGTEQPGDYIGNYKLLEQIGEGGCGVVFMAEQRQPVHRKVALKIIKPGMDTKNVIARFEAERQALALMDHPNIARIFDAGATQSGRPYFVMELVHGVMITDYCDRLSLPTNARLKLFAQVCEAIQHAHQKGIIHRDIKPANILVTTELGENPAPKVIDFGIAKAISGQQLTDKTVFTAREMLIGTPAYMSPEQATLSSAEVDTRTDIYSLGVLLYELLTGTTPFDTRELLKAGFDEIRRVIRDVEPVRPSTRLTTMTAADLAGVSKRHGTEAPKLIREIRGDLDWIVIKTLEKDRSRRYATANALTVEIERYLAGDIVLARPPSKLYKAHRLVARNKLFSCSLAMIFVLLAAGLAVEKHAREKAEHQEDVYRLEGLGIMYWQQGKFSDADKCFRQSFIIRRQFLGGQPPNVIVAAQFLVLLQQENKYDDANQLFAGFPKSQLLAVPGYAGMFGKIGEDVARTGRWEQATNNATFLVQAEPGSPKGYHMLAPLLVACGNVSEYRRLCKQIIPRFSGTQDPLIADPMAKDCLILPSSGADLKAVGVLADVAVNRGTNYSSYSLFQCCKALSEYRLEHFAEAIQWADSASKDSFSYSKAEAYAILCMAQFKSARTNEALIALAHCSKVIDEELPKLSSGNLGGDWRDWIIAHALQSEAKGMIEGKPTATERPANLAP